MKQRQNSLRKARHGPVAGRPRLRRRRLSWQRMLLLALALTGSFMVSVGEKNRAAIAEVMRDPLSILAQRSPGQRGAGALLPTKPARTRVAAAPVVPNERVLPVVRMRPPLVPVMEPLGLDSIIPDIAPPVFFVPDNVAGGIPAAAGTPIMLPVTENRPPATEIRLPAAVPEPETWLTMIFGFFAVGRALRSRRTRAPGKGQEALRPAGRP